MKGRWSLPGPLTANVQRELARFGPAGNMAEIVAAWPPAVGAPVAANAWPARVARDGTLHVATSSSTWAYELSQLEAQILARLRDALGGRAPHSVRFAIGRVPSTGPESVESPARPVPRVTEDERRRGKEIAAPIGDADLRELVARAAAASLAGPGTRPV